MVSERDLGARPISEHEERWLRHELAEAHATIRKLLRQIDKTQARSAEIARAYKLTVDNLVEMTRANAELERERDTWRARAACAPESPTLEIAGIALTQDEISAIRRAMARLHHPDAGGDAARMQAWNAALDALER